MNSGRGTEDILDPDSFRRIADVRRDVWTGGFTGLAVGISFGVMAYFVSSRYPPLKQYKTNNHFVLITLISGSLCSFVGSLSSGRNSIQYVGDIFRNKSISSSYVSTMKENENDLLNQSEEAYARRVEAIRKKKEGK
mmetsp:Transcript_18296/g.18378  ORF Transcript_18296/g.18378 Transcript_18296/m.18378 type:complete len:137 (+) Transcript_18296:232-642(+)|eukprot:CAMPEP_0182425834 /NCGR_PEP_ID=MMETSP1167-20130531/12327_1 /TAXON_ID=2988 /ORGANISM="Mallomonas Sp, Strain CCMP3275" /LENGTH=136 /DNA_ID=CAMNT_0024606857 /DNA_START=188 /DNA_END=598 /DNA_ORIENTATION=-